MLFGVSLDEELDVLVAFPEQLLIRCATLLRDRLLEGVMVGGGEAVRDVVARERVPSPVLLRSVLDRMLLQNGPFPSHLRLAGIAVGRGGVVAVVPAVPDKSSAGASESP